MAMRTAEGSPRIVGRRTVWNKRRVEAFEEIVEFPGGYRQEFILLSGGDGVGVVAFDDRERLILTKEYRAGIGRYIHTLPGGGLDPGEDVATAARREFLEETGFRLEGAMEPLAVFNSTSGWVRGDIHILRAPHPAVQAEVKPDPREIVAVDLVSWERALAMVMDGEIRDSVLMVALLLMDRRQLFPKP